MTADEFVVGDRGRMRYGPPPRPAGEVLAVVSVAGRHLAVIDWGMVDPRDWDLRPRVTVCAFDDLEVGDDEGPSQ